MECLKDLTTPRAPSPTRASLKFWPGMNVVDVGTRLVIAVTNIFWNKYQKLDQDWF